MRLILSRKGFDSGAGGCPSPIFTDGQMTALPIPDRASSIRYDELRMGEMPLAPIVEDLTKGRIPGRYCAHLDPDLRAESYPRATGWQPLFGQEGAAQGHLTRQRIGPGDLLLFFGLFRKVKYINRQWWFIPKTRPLHVIWGWFQIGQMIDPSTLDDKMMGWAGYHPHCSGNRKKNNALYLAKRQLELPELTDPIPGAGVFSEYDSKLLLTDLDQDKVTTWRVPPCFDPTGKPSALSYHSAPHRWQTHANHITLQSVARGQEFVLDCAQYPGVLKWAGGLIKNPKAAWGTSEI